MQVLYDLYEILAERKAEFTEGSYTCYLFSAGLDKILKKVGEEAAETIIAAKNGDKEGLVGEAADLLFHLLVMLKEQGIDLKDLDAELCRRREKQGNLKVFTKSDKNT